MKRALTSLLALGLVLSADAYPAVSSGPVVLNQWNKNMTAALAKAKELNRPAMVAVLDTVTCSYSKKWDAAILSMPEWPAFIAANPMVLILVDRATLSTSEWITNTAAYRSPPNTGGISFPTVAIHHPSGALADKFLARDALGKNPGFYTRVGNTTRLYPYDPSYPTAPFYVDASRPDDSGHGLSWAYAKKTIQAAINEASNGTIILVTNGVYNTGTSVTPGHVSLNRVVITNNVTVKSINGPGATVIEGSGTECYGTTSAVRCVYMSDGILDGFTLRNGATRAPEESVEYWDCVGGGANCSGENSRGIIRNAIFKNNKAWRNAGIAGVSEMENCVLTGNVAVDAGGAGSAAHTNVNCTIVGNSASRGGGIWDSMAQHNNCVIWGNAGGNYGDVPAIRFSCTTPLAPGPGNTSNDPLFADAGNGDFRLQPNSPCLDTGDNACVQSSVDLDGKIRILNGTVDMGAYEFGTIGELVTITFDSQGGLLDTASKVASTGSAYGMLPVPTRNGYNFIGWFTGEGDEGALVTSSTVIAVLADHTLYAHWDTDSFSVPNGPDVIPVGNTAAVQSADENSGDGGFSVRLGGVGLLSDGGAAGIEWTVTGPGVLAFDWKVSSEADWDVLSFYEVGGAVTNRISGTTGGWSRVYASIPSASDAIHTFRWEYAKDAIGDFVGEDCGWVDAISWSPLYLLTVNNGAGDGAHTNGALVTITADLPPQWQRFERWTGDTNVVSDVFEATTTLAMPATGIVVTATYTPILYCLSVADGSGSGQYLYATAVEIGAVHYGDKRFYRWTGDVDCVADVAAATTTVLMAGQPVSLSATYIVPLTVNAGTGGGWHPEGAHVTVTADPDPMYMEFAGWTGECAGFLTDTAARTTTLTMPSHPASMTATYRDSVARVAGCYGRTFTVSGTAGGVTTDASAGPPSGTPAVKLGGAGVVPDGGFTSFETQVSGSGTVTFWWKVSSESSADYLKFSVDDVQIEAISGTKVPWEQFSYRIEGAGVHKLRWEYAKNGSLASSTDAGWVDDIVWIGDVPVPVIRPDIVSIGTYSDFLKCNFVGERGVTYVIQTNESLSSLGWGDYAIVPSDQGETNGMRKFEAGLEKPLEKASMFYRVIGR